MSTPKPFIAPTIGRVVWFYPFAKSGESGFVTHIIGIEAAGTEQPYAAIVAHVWSDSMVNLTVFDANGNAHSRTSVELLQEATAERVVAGGFCTWMPFQKGQAARQDAAAPVAMVGLPVREVHREEHATAVAVEALRANVHKALDEGLMRHMTGAADPAWSSPDDTHQLLDFAAALRALKHGEWVARRGWNGKGMFLLLVRPDDDTMVPSLPAYSVLGVSDMVSHCLPWIGMKTADNKLVPWLASQTDMLADDWTVVT